MSSAANYCVFENSKQITNNDTCVVGILRKESVNHTFIMVHGIQNNQHFLRRYDFVTDMSDAEEKQLEDSPILGTLNLITYRRKGKIKPKESEHASQEKALSAFIHVYLDGEQNYLQKSWQIEIEEAEALHDRILAQASKPPDYQASGDLASGPASSSQLGENCLSWCKKHLKQINERIKNDLPPQITDIIAAMPTWELPQSIEASVQSPRRKGLLGSFRRS